MAAFIFCFLFLFQTPAGCQEPKRPFTRGMFVSVIQDPPALSNTAAMTQLVEFAKTSDIHVLFVQIYYANKAWFPSQVGDSTPYEECLKNVGTDPFALLIEKAHAAGIEIHAWLNMLSLNNNQDAPLLKKYGPGILTRDASEKKSLEDYKIDRQYFLEPGDPRTREELVTLVAEIVRGYPDLDGIQFDYIRYPDNHPVYGRNEMNMQRFQKTAGLQTFEDSNPLWQDWKRAQVTEFLQVLVHRARTIRSDIRISVTGCMPYARAYHEAFQDWPSWIDQGIVDFVTLMNYSPDPVQFKRWNLQAMEKTKNLNKVRIGVGAYKLVQSPEIFAKEFESCEKTGAGACVVFHYGALLENAAMVQLLQVQK